jgi:hypothetical protein
MRPTQRLPDVSSRIRNEAVPPILPPRSGGAGGDPGGSRVSRVRGVC